MITELLVPVPVTPNFRSKLHVTFVRSSDVTRFSGPRATRSAVRIRARFAFQPSFHGRVRVVLGAVARARPYVLTVVLTFANLARPLRVVGDGVGWE